MGLIQFKQIALRSAGFRSKSRTNGNAVYRKKACGSVCRGDKKGPRSRPFQSGDSGWRYASVAPICLGASFGLSV